MLYTSTRDGSVSITGSQAIVNGISKDGGLYVPSSFPKYSLNDIARRCVDTGVCHVDNSFSLARAFRAVNQMYQY